MPIKYTRQDIYVNLRSKNVLENEDQQATAVEVFNEIGEILNELKDGDTLELRGIGVFKAKFQPGRVYNNINTRKKEMSSGKTVIKFHRIKRGEFLSAEDKAEIEASDQISPHESKPEYVSPIPVRKPHVPPVTSYKVYSDQQETSEKQVEEPIISGEEPIVKLKNLKEIREFVIRKVRAGYPWSSFDYTDYIADEHHHMAKTFYNIELAKQSE